MSRQILDVADRFATVIKDDQCVALVFKWPDLYKFEAEIKRDRSDASAALSRPKEAAPSEEAKLLQEARIALGMMLSYHGPGNAEYTDAAQFTAQEAFDNIDKFQSATQAPEETKDRRRSNEDREAI